MKMISLRRARKRLPRPATWGLPISLICALCLWSYVIATNPDITQDKVLSGVSMR